MKKSFGKTKSRASQLTSIFQASFAMHLYNSFGGWLCQECENLDTLFTKADAKSSDAWDCLNLLPGALRKGGSSIE